MNDDLADPMLQSIRDRGKNHEEFKALVEYLRNNGENIPSILSHMKSVLSDVSTDDGLVLLRQRLFILKNMRKKI